LQTGHLLLSRVDEYFKTVFQENTVDYSIIKHSASVCNSKYLIGSWNGEIGSFFSFLSGLHIGNAGKGENEVTER
jgi:hypothetical protein